MPVGAALLLGAYLVAQEMTNREPAGETQRRMECALSSLAADLQQAAPEFFVTGQMPELGALTHGWPSDDAVRFLVELRVGNPFYPYEFELTEARERERLAALREMSRAVFRLPAGTADSVSRAWETVRAAEKSYLRRQALQRKIRSPQQWLAVAGVGAAVAGVAVAAAPAVAVLMPAAANLSGAAAVSAGLAQLGFGSVAAGGLGMVGGVWMLGLGGATLGVSAATTATLLSRPGSAALVGVEVHKLLISFLLARQNVLKMAAEEFSHGLDALVNEVASVQQLERTRNEDGSPRLRELGDLQRRLTFAGEFLTARSGPSGGSPAAPGARSDRPTAAADRAPPPDQPG